jgi:hypothetical protein
MNLEEALEHAARGEGVLFLGAGFSIGAINAKDQEFRSGRALAEFLSTRTGLPGGSPLEDAAEAFAGKLGVDELIKELRREYTVKQVTQHQQTIAALPWKRSYTTNYDNVFETAAVRGGKVVVPVSPDSKVQLTAKLDPLCIHLNGYINCLNRDTIWNSFKLTDTSYSTASIEASEWAPLLRQDIRFARAVFFVGYSLFDLDIKRILRSAPDLTEKTFFILHDGVDEITEARARRFGQVSKIATQGLADIVSAGGYLNPRPPEALNIGRSIIEYTPPGMLKVPTDRQFLDLVLLGNFDPTLIPADSSSRNLYNCDRTVVADLVSQLETGGSRAAVLHSEIANGKTITTSLVAKVAFTRGWRVFLSAELSEYSERELRDIAQLPGKILLLVDDYNDWLRQLSGLLSVSGDRFAIIVTARSNAHDVAFDSLTEALAPLHIQELSLNALTKEEVEWWVQTLDTYGLWGDIAGRSRAEKVRYINDDCNGQIQAVLLRVFDSPLIKARFSEAAAAIKSNPLAEKVAITVFALTILNQRPTVETIADIWGVDALERRGVHENRGIAQFIDISRSSVLVRSSAAAEYLLNHFWSAADVAEVLLEMAKAANRLYNVSIRYEGLFKSLMRFSSIQQILPESGRRHAVVTYYEKLKLMDRCSRNPLFWLQYAIGSLVTGDLIRASKYFDTSYSLAERMDWDTFQIDNHYARYLLVRASEDAPFEEAVELFRQARTLINRQIKVERLHYPFRVASSYQGFYDRFQSRFTEEELKEIAQAARTVVERISQLTSDRAENRYVRRCSEAMDYIVRSVAARLPPQP